jgi:drug/metabolite transporter (DMT)-like permease
VFWKSLVSKLGFRLSASLRFLTTWFLAFIAILLFWDISTLSSFESFHWQLFILIVFTSWAWALSLYYYWLKNISASKATIFELAWPLSGVFFDWYFNGNILNSTQIIFSIVLLVCFFMIISEKKAILN